MRAVQFEDESTISLGELPRPTLGDSEALVQVGVCGICASDLHAAVIKAGITKIRYPYVPGHELAGKVVEVGRAVTSVQVGDSVTVQPVIPCRLCELCRKGLSALCRAPTIIGLHRPGGFAQWVAVPETNLYLTGDLPDAVAACTEPLACALHGLVRLAPSPTDRVLLFGAGGIGLSFLQLLRLQGVGQIVVVDLHTFRLEKARHLGADQVLAVDDRLKGELHQLGGSGFDCVVDATGVPQVVESAFEWLGPASKLLMLGSCPSASVITLRPRIIQGREATLLGAFGFHNQFGRALGLLKAGRIDTDAVVTHTMPLESFDQAITLARTGRESIKIQVKP